MSATAKHAGGRPTIMTEAVLKKLEEAFAIGASDNEACIFADITPTTLYNYQKAHPEFVERKTLLKDRPILKARNTVVKALDEPEHAQWYLERKRKAEFGAKGAIEDLADAGIGIVLLPPQKGKGK